MSNPKFGDRVAVSAKLVRKKEYDCVEEKGSEESYPISKNSWVPESFSATGIFLGIRTLSDGLATECTDYKAEHRFQAAVVCPGPHQNNVYVPLDAIEIIGKEG